MSLPVSSIISKMPQEHVENAIFVRVGLKHHESMF